MNLYIGMSVVLVDLVIYVFISFTCSYHLSRLLLLVCIFKVHYGNKMI